MTENKKVKMKIIEATPPDDFPDQVIMMDKEIADRHPDKVFYLRIRKGNGVDIVHLDHAVTPLDARTMSRKLGYEPTHWMIVGKSITMF